MQTRILRKKGSRRSSYWSSTKTKRRGVLLILVLIVVGGVSLTALAFSEAMLAGYEESQLVGKGAQARATADSGVAAVRVFLTNPRTTRTELGGVWDNRTYFQAANVVADTNVQELSHFSVVAPNLDDAGRYASVRYGLQNESAKLNLNALVVIDEQFANSASAIAALAGGDSGTGLSALGLPSDASSTATDSGSGISSSSTGRQMLMGLPGMTEYVADAILDFIDADDEPREYGAEREYYTALSSPYAPPNGPLVSVDQLLLVKGVTAQQLYGLDQNRNGLLDSFEQSIFTNTASASSNGQSAQPPALGWAAYLSIASREKNVASDGNPRINVNSADVTTLLQQLTDALGNESWASFIVAYRVHGGQSGSQQDLTTAAILGSGAAGIGAPGGGRGGPGGGRGNNQGGNNNGNQGGGGRGGPGGGGGGGGPGGGQGGGGGGPRGGGGGGPGGGGGGGPGGGGRGGRSTMLFDGETNRPFRFIAMQGPGMGGQGGYSNAGGGPRGGTTAPAAGNTRGNNAGGNGGNNGGNMKPGGSGSGSGGGNAQPVPWVASALQLEEGAQGSVSLRQVLDLIGATVTISQGNFSSTYTSPFASDPIAMSTYLPILMEKLTTVDSPVIAGRININEAPREIMAGLPGMTEEIIEQIMGARAQKSESQNRAFETWPMVEGYLTLQQMRLIQPLITGGGDLYKAQVIGYYEQGAAFSRIEVLIDASEAKPKVISYRRLDHLGRGFSNTALGQRSLNNTTRSR